MPFMRRRALGLLGLASAACTNGMYSGTPAADTRYVTITHAAGPTYRESLHIDVDGTLTHQYADWETRTITGKELIVRVERTCMGTLGEADLRNVVRAAGALPRLAGNYEPAEQVYDGLAIRTEASIGGKLYAARSYFHAGPRQLHDLNEFLWSLRGHTSACTTLLDGRPEDAFTRAMQVNEAAKAFTQPSR